MYNLCFSVVPLLVVVLNTIAVKQTVKQCSKYVLCNRMCYE